MGLAALDVLTISIEPSLFLTSQVQPDPKLPIPDLMKAALNSSKEPNAASIASPRAPEGEPPPSGLRPFQ
jgi:hypothetical protein